MPRSPQLLPAGMHVSDKMSLGIFAQTFPVEAIQRSLIKAGNPTLRNRDLPNHIVVYFVMMLGLFRNVSQTEVLRLVYEGLKYLVGPSQQIKITGKSGISGARARVGWEPFREVFHEIAKPLGMPGDKGCFYHGHRIMGIDGSQLNVADNAQNDEAFGRPSGRRGDGAYPMISTVSLIECGTHAFVRSALGKYRDSEQVLCREVLPALDAGMICLADRNFMGFKLFCEADETGAKLLWRTRKDFTLAVVKELPDGSYLSKIYSKEDTKRVHGKTVRVIEYRVLGAKGEDPIILTTNWLDHREAPAGELADLYHERWEYENAMDELKTHLGAESTTMRSYSPDLVRQEWFGTLMTHYAIRAVMHAAARKSGLDDDDLSFTHSVRVIRRRLPMSVNFPPSSHLQDDVE